MGVVTTIAGARITTKFGVVDALHTTPHKGLDLALPEGSPLYSIGRGIVENVVDYGAANIGKGVIVKLDNGMRIIYGHLSQAKVVPGQHIEPGQVLALSGNTGRSTGPHLHLQVQNPGGNLTDPTPFAEDVIKPHESILQQVNPFDGLQHQLEALNGKIDHITYWLNPKHIFDALGHGIHDLVVAPATGTWIMGGTIVGLMLIMLGANFPKKWLFWGWVVYWTLRGFLFV